MSALTFATVGACVIVGAALAIIHVGSGDSAVYFTYFKRFFDLPFSYGPGQVSFGATSPLEVVVNSPLALLFGNNFITPCRVLAGALLALSAILLARAMRNPENLAWNTLLAAALVAVNLPLILSSSQLFETPLAYALVSAVYFAMRTGRPNAAAISAGLLPLARPETALVSLFVYGWALNSSANRRRTVITILVSLTPGLAYLAYMYSATGGIIPTSISARVLATSEGSHSWPYAISASFGRPFWTTPENAIYPLGAIVCIVALLRFGWQRIRLELVLLVLLIAPFVVQPPMSYASRYLEITTPILTALALKAAQQLPWRQVALPATVAAVLALAWHLLHPYINLYRSDSDRLLLSDLATDLNPRLNPRDKILLYEIQGQYYLQSKAVSADGIVGGEALPALRGEISWLDFIHKERIDYIVTMDAFAYRSIYKHTILERLYANDLDHPIGTRLRAGGLTFTKVLTNPDFADPNLYMTTRWSGLNTGSTLRMYGPSIRGWADSFILWNSVYRVTT